ncbi:MAG: deoxynucleoside kinase [Spirochaetia bacterium]|jgi:deoxyadenosine/deoxycytidine kinase|nr:deoxynucleoside kinase [Spirochaetia bacterium]
MKKYLVLAGNIGAGKSTLVSLLSKKLGYLPYFEPVAENPFLKDFYADMRRWAFHSQVFFLTSRAKAHRRLTGDMRSVVQDRSLYEDAEVFAKNLYRQGAMGEQEWATYMELYQTLASILPPPDLVIYIRASVDTLKSRIAKRARDFETSIPESYLLGLNSLYEEWIQGFTLAPVLTIPGDRFDFVEDSRDLFAICATVKKRLQDPQNLLFPYEM